MDAWGGIIGAMRSSDKSTFDSLFTANSATDNMTTAQALQQYVSSIFQLLNVIANDMNRSEALMRASMGVIG